MQIVNELNPEKMQFLISNQNGVKVKLCRSKDYNLQFVRRNSLFTKPRNIWDKVKKSTYLYLRVRVFNVAICIIHV